MFLTYSHLIFREPETPETPTQPPTPEKTIVEFKNRIKVIKDNVLIAKNLVVTKRLDLLDYKISEAQKHLNRVDNKDGQDNSFQNLLKGKGLRSDVGQERKGEKLLQDVEVGLAALEKEFGIEKKVIPQTTNEVANELLTSFGGDASKMAADLDAAKNEKDPQKQEAGIQGVVKDIQKKADEFLKNNTKLSPSERSNVMMLATAAVLFRGAPKARDMMPSGFINKALVLAGGYYGYQAVGGDVIADMYNKNMGVSAESSSTGGVDAFPMTLGRKTAESIVNTLPNIFDIKKGPVDLSPYINVNGIETTKILALPIETFVDNRQTKIFLAFMKHIDSGQSPQTQKDIVAYCQELFGASLSSTPKAPATKPAMPPSESDSSLSPVAPTIVDEKPTPEKTGPTLSVADLNGKINDYKEKQTNMMTELKDAGYQLVPKPDWTQKEIATFKACLVEANNSKNYNTLKNKGWIKKMDNQRPDETRINNNVAEIRKVNISKILAEDICLKLADLKGDKEFGPQFKDAKFEENGGHVYYVNNSRRVPFTVSKDVLSVDLGTMELKTTTGELKGNTFSSQDAPSFLWGLEAFVQAFGYAGMIDPKTSEKPKGIDISGERPFDWKESKFIGSGSIETHSQSKLFSFTNTSSPLNNAIKNMKRTPEKDTGAKHFAQLLNSFNIWTTDKEVPPSITASGKEEGTVLNVKENEIQSLGDLVRKGYDVIKSSFKTIGGDLIDGTVDLGSGVYGKILKNGVIQLWSDLEKGTTYVYNENIIPGCNALRVDLQASVIHLLDATGNVMKHTYGQFTGFVKSDLYPDFAKAIGIMGKDVGEMIKTVTKGTVDAVADGASYTVEKIDKLGQKHRGIRAGLVGLITNYMGGGPGWIAANTGISLIAKLIGL